MKTVAATFKCFNLNAKSKIIIALTAVLFLVSTARGYYYILLLYFILSILVAIIFKSNFLFLIKRSLLLFLYPFFISIFIPFANKGNILFEYNLNLFNITITDNGVTIFFTVLLKSFISIFILSSLVISTSDNELLYGLRKIHVPAILVPLFFYVPVFFCDKRRIIQRTACHKKQDF